MCWDSISHQAWEYQVLLGDVIDWKFHTDHNGCPLGCEGHALGRNENSKWVPNPCRQGQGIGSAIPPLLLLPLGSGVLWQNRKGPPSKNSDHFWLWPAWGWGKPSLKASSFSVTLRDHTRVYVGSILWTDEPWVMGFLGNSTLRGHLPKHRLHLSHETEQANHPVGRGPRGHSKNWNSRK